MTKRSPTTPRKMRPTRSGKRDEGGSDGDAEDESDDEDEEEDEN